MSEPVDHNQSADQSRSGFLWELIRTGLLVLLIVLPIRLFIAQPFIVSGASMEPTFSSGDYLIIDQISYEFQAPKRQDVAVFRYPNNPNQFYIKRIIGLPGETVHLTNGKIKIINDKHPDGLILDEPYLATKTDTDEELKITLDEDEYFVLGDNRESSSDSRSWGALPKRFLVGHPLIQLLPPDEASVSPGNTPSPRAP